MTRASVKRRLDKLERAVHGKKDAPRIFVARADGLIEDNGELLTQEELQARYPGIVIVTVGFDLDRL